MTINCPALPSPSASPAAAPGQLIVVAVDTVRRGGTLRVVRTDGTLVHQLGLNPGAHAVRAAGSRIFVLEDDGAIKALHMDGSFEDLGNLGTASPFGFVVSPDGRRWMWGTVIGNHGQVYVAGDGMSARLVAESTESTRAIQPYSWTPVAAFLHDAPIGIGGYILFSPALGPVQKVDPNTFAVTAVSHTDGCAFSDMAQDGTIACFQGGSKTLNLIAPDGTSIPIQLAQPSNALNGDAYFSRDGQLVTVASAYGNQNQERYATDLVAKQGGSPIRRIIVDGVRPSEALQAQTWLDDGSLVVYQPPGAAGGSLGLYVASPFGDARQILKSGVPIGVLAG